VDFVIFILAMGSLITGADLIVNQSERVAIHFNVSEFVIGATVIAIGTSLPEIATSVMASFNNKPEIAITNAIGSNIFNITLVLALLFILTKNIKPHRDFFAKDTTWALVPVMLFIIMSIDGKISKFDATLLLVLMFAYIRFLLNDAPDMENEDIENIKKENRFLWIKTILLFIVGFILVVIGAHFTVESASGIATGFGISDRVITIIMISFGTSLPELAISISASIKGKVDMAIGNIIGSNLANLTLVIGLSALVKELPIDLTIKNVIFDVSIMTVATIMLVYITANKLYNRPAGISLMILLALFLEGTYRSISSS
jgi:cation:H+ antiporter